MELLKISSGRCEITFNSENGGLPSKVAVLESDNRTTELFGENSWMLEVELENGEILHPVAEKKNIDCYEEGNSINVVFRNLHFVNAEGKLFPDHYLCMSHEFFADGTAFSEMFFFVRDINAVGIKRFEVIAKPDFEDFDTVRWSCRQRPLTVDGTLVTAQCDRYLPAGSDQHFESASVPLFGFNACRNFAPSLYADIFMEGHASLSQKVEDVSTTVKWQNNSPELRWNFQNKPFPKPVINQLRNRWGWVIRPAENTRHLPPMRMYHYFDNYLRYPDADMISAIAASGCDIMIIHENWRSDTQNDGIPFDPEAFIKMRDALHANNIRLAVYIRGNEESVVARQAYWFKRLLKYNFDGLYMDYGSPCSHLETPTEGFCGGRILFRKHYSVMGALREMVGPDGLLFSHTGPSFSALSMPFMTGYVSGEGERGLLIRSREEYEYFSMAPVITGTLWSAAFPEYASREIIPFLAASGQYPHSALGRQFKSSSLVHPSVPGINDTAFEELWDLWSVFRNEKDISIVNDYNSCGIFPKDKQAGHYLMISQKKNLALLILSNFNENPTETDCSVDWAKCGLDISAMNIYLLDKKSVTAQNVIPSSLQVEGFGVIGILLSVPEIDVNGLTCKFVRPKAELGATGKAYLAEVAQQKEAREKAFPWKETWIRLSVIDLTPTPYEDSMTLDLFDNAFELGEVMPDGSFRRIGWVDKRGFSTEYDIKQDLFAGDAAPPVKLNDLFAPGVRNLALFSTHFGQPFYSFGVLEIASSAEFGSETRKIEFLNDLEPDRAFLHFTVSL